MFLIAAFLAGCGGGGSDETVTLQGGQTVSVSEVADEIAANGPRLQVICTAIDKKGFVAALAEYEKGYRLSPLKDKVPAADLFAAIAEHC